MPVASCVDEDRIKSAFEQGENAIGDLTVELAAAKARSVSARYPYSYVLGADQILVCDNIRFDKPKSIAEARDHLMTLRGRDHYLVNGLVVVKNDEQTWAHQSRVHLKMRDFSDDFLNRYLSQMGDKVLRSVGGYLLEETGSQLFETIEGDYFSVLGLPLLPLLAYLRDIHIVDV